MKYPYFSNWIKVSEIPDSDKYLVCERITGKLCIVNLEDLLLAKRFDGNTPPEEILGVLSEYEAQACLDMLRAKLLIRRDHGFSAFGKLTLFKAIYIHMSSIKKIQLYSAYNRSLILLSMPVLLASVFCLFVSHPRIVYSDLMAAIGAVMGMIIVSVIHEFSHFSSGVAYGADVYEYGIRLLPSFGGYTFMSSDNITDYRKLIQINAAGVESNILIAGVFILLSCLVNDTNMIWFCAGTVNVLGALVNLIPVRDLDGNRILRIMKKRHAFK